MGLVEAALGGHPRPPGRIDGDDFVEIHGQGVFVDRPVVAQQRRVDARVAEQCGQARAVLAAARPRACQPCQ